MACDKCGQVSSERVQENRAEWRNFESEKVNRSRVGSPTSLTTHDMGLATVIGRENKDSSGRRLDASMNATMQRLRTWDFITKAYSSTKRNLIHAFIQLGNLKDKLGLSDAIMEKTAYIYRKAQDKGLVRGRSTSSILGAAIYTACREMGASRTLKDVASATDVKRKDISRSYRLLALNLDIKAPLIDPAKCVAVISNKAGLNEKTKRMAMDTMHNLIERGLSAGKLPMGLAATVLYMSCLDNHEHKTQKDIASLAGVTEVTIRNRLKDIKMRRVLN